MNGPELVDAVKARLEAQVPGWTTYAHGVPDGTLPDRYRIVRGSEGWEQSTRSTGTTNVQTPQVWVTSVVRFADARFAAQEAAKDAAAVRAALRNWRPDGGWLLRANGSQPAGRSESTPDTTAFAVEQFSLRSSI